MAFEATTPDGLCMTASLNGKTLFITGASRGIGLAIAKRAAADGANIAIAAKTTELNELGTQLKTAYLRWEELAAME